MTYIISDLHIYPLEKFKKLLAKAGFGEDMTAFFESDTYCPNMLCYKLTGQALKQKSRPSRAPISII